MYRWKTLALALSVAAMWNASMAAAAQKSQYPDKPIRFVVPFAPGGGTDIIARVMAQKLSESFGQSVVVDNRGGAGGTIGAEIAAKATPDGYTMIMVSGSYAVNAGLYKLPYDPLNDIDAISLVGTTPFIVAVHPSVAAKNVKELIALARAKPGSLNYASTGTGGITHMATELFRLMAGINMVHIPYKGTGPALTDVMGGQVQMIIGAILATLPHVKSAKLRGIAVTGPKRTEAARDLPTVTESGLPGYEVTLWYGVWGPRGLPKNIVALWNAELAKVLNSADMKARLAAEGLEAVGSTPEAFRAHLKTEIVKWTKVIKDANVKAGS